MPFILEVEIHSIKYYVPLVHHHGLQRESPVLTNFATEFWNKLGVLEFS